MYHDAKASCNHARGLGVLKLPIHFAGVFSKSGSSFHMVLLSHHSETWLVSSMETPQLALVITGMDLLAMVLDKCFTFTGILKAVM